MAVGDVQILVPPFAAMGQLELISDNSGAPSTLHTTGTATFGGAPQFADDVTASFVNLDSVSRLLTFEVVGVGTPWTAEVLPGNGLQLVLDRKRLFCSGGGTAAQLTVYTVSGAQVAVDLNIARIQIA